MLVWPGMPAQEALGEAARRLGTTTIEAVVVSSNERLEAELAAGAPFDLVFPSDYLVERLGAAGRLMPLDGLPLERLAAWAVAAEYDPGCGYSVPFAYGTTGILRGPHAAPSPSWWSLLRPPAGTPVGMLDEAREVIGAALMALGRSPNDTGQDALREARRVLFAQQPNVADYDSDDFCEPVARGEVAAHQAWSGPAAQAVRGNAGLSYIAPIEGATLWTTAAAIPIDAPDAERSLRLLRELMDPELAALTTARNGYATPNRPARALLPAALREDPMLFPDARVRARCHTLKDLGSAEARLLDIWTELLGRASKGGDTRGRERT